jgi:hypothetical protein
MARSEFRQWERATFAASSVTDFPPADAGERGGSGGGGSKNFRSTGSNMAAKASQPRFTLSAARFARCRALRWVLVRGSANRRRLAMIAI